MTNFSKMRLGKKPERIDPRTFKLKTFLKADAIAPIPKAVDWAQWVLEPGMMRNDEIGLCVVAGKAHQIQTWTASRGRMWRPSDADVVEAYITISGLDGTPYNPATGENDDGLVILDAMKYWRAHGLWGHQIGAFAKVDHTNLAEVRMAIALFGGVTIGVGLPNSAQNQEYWTVEDLSLKDDSAPYTWGGHDVYVPAYDASSFTCVTWGEMQPMSLQWFKAYVEECWVALSSDWVSGREPAPNGFDLERLQKVLAGL
jgi:hypothetical protein